jgi:hypothetical protein
MNPKLMMEKKLWNTLNEIMGRNDYVANYLNDYFIGKVGKRKQEMPTKNREPLY